MAQVNGQFTLIDHHGEPVTPASYSGLFMLVYFGFTHCRVVCPRTLKKLSSVLADLGALAGQIKPLYISVDAARDTPEVMRIFLQANYPAFTGLTGAPDQIEAAKRSFRVFAQVKSDGDTSAGYDVPHTAITYLLGPTGVYLAHFAEGAGEAQIVARIRDLMIDQRPLASTLHARTPRVQ